MQKTCHACAGFTSAFPKRPVGNGNFSEVLNFGKAYKRTNPQRDLFEDQDDLIRKIPNCQLQLFTETETAN